MGREIYRQWHIVFLSEKAAIEYINKQGKPEDYFYAIAGKNGDWEV